MNINDDGSSIFKARVNGIEEIAMWVVSQGNSVKVIKPLELKDEVIKIAKMVLNNYQ